MRRRKHGKKVLESNGESLFDHFIKTFSAPQTNLCIDVERLRNFQTKSIATENRLIVLLLYYYTTSISERLLNIHICSHLSNHSTCQISHFLVSSSINIYRCFLLIVILTVVWMEYTKYHVPWQCFRWRWSGVQIDAFAQVPPVKRQFYR